MIVVVSFFLLIKRHEFRRGVQAEPRLFWVSVARLFLLT